MKPIKQLIGLRNPKTLQEAKLTLREILQKVVLIGLANGGFFDKASFYGGAAS